MGKREAGKFVHRKHDAYDTPGHAIEPLLPHLKPGTRFIEPCVGSGSIVQYLEARGHQCIGGLDVAPRFATAGDVAERQPIWRGDASKLDMTKIELDPDCFITNPPWTAALMHAILFNLYWQRPFWMLTSADWMHTRQAGPYLPLVRKIVSIGRVRWMEGHPEDKGHTPYDNCAWYLLAPPPTGPEFVGRR